MHLKNSTHFPFDVCLFFSCLLIFNKIYTLKMANFCLYYILQLFFSFVVTLKAIVFVYFCYVDESLSHVQLLVTQWTLARQAPLSFTIYQSLIKLMSIFAIKFFKV